MWSRQDIAGRILAGDNLVIYNGNLLRIPDKWLEAHPGGSLAILHFVGRDATDEIDAYHSEFTRSLVARYAIGKVHLTDGAWPSLVPPIMNGWVRKMCPETNSRIWHSEAAPLICKPSQTLLLPASQSFPDGPTLESLEPLPSSTLSLSTQAAHSKAYKELHQRIMDAGLYDTPYISGYGPEIIRYCLLAFSSYYAYQHEWFMTSAVFLGFVWHQLVFSAHDLGHMGVTHNWTIDRIIAILIANFIGGLSIGWWVQVCAMSMYIVA
jgi:sphingolipid 8-(E)-desaturase